MPKVLQFVTVIAGACWYQLAIREDTWGPEQQLEAFAASKHLAWLSMWSAGRDTECPGGAQSFAQSTCSSIVQAPDQFMDTLGAY